MRCALVNLTTNLVENLIIAEPDDPVPDGYLLVCDPVDYVGLGTVWDGQAKVLIDPGIGMTSPEPIDGMETL